MRNIYISVFLSFVVSIFCSNSIYAQVYPADFGQVVVATGMKVATAVAFAPDGRIFVTEQTGNIRIIKNNTLLPTPFANVSTTPEGERGLLGIAIDPDFSINKYVYVYYTAIGSPVRNRISRFTATTDVAAAGSETIILNLDPLSTATIHNGGAIHFGKDGKLYVAVGENANQPAAQNLDTYHGKLLRINKDGSVPEGNPFPTGSEQRRRIWAYGLRNPFTFSVDRESGKIFVNDVGHGLWEEINDATVGGRNFGWPTTEGMFNQATHPNLSNPIYAYAHGSGDAIGCAIVGGAYVSPSNTNYPANYRGRYFFQDFCNNWINTIDVSAPTTTRSTFATSMISNSLGMTMGPDGYIYYLARQWEGLIKIVYNNNTAAPSITTHPVNTGVAIGQPASFSVSALGTAPLTYQWQKNGVNIPGATSASFQIASIVATDAGQYRVIVTNSVGNVTSNAAALSVISNVTPVAEIITPITGATYIAGTTINFSGQGNDQEDGSLPAQAFSWAINFHHNTHHHDQPAINGITSGTFNVPNIGETSDNVWYRIILTVTDANGLKGKDSVDIIPMKSNINLATVPQGLQITLDGTPFNTPGSVVSVEGLVRTLGVISPQTINNQTYEFSSWSHGGAETQTISTPVNDVTYTANFTPVSNTNTFYRAFNLNGPSVSIDGNNWEASSNAPNFSTTGWVFASQGVSLVPPTDANRASMIRSSFWGNPTMTVRAVPPGSYQVWAYVWEDNSPATFSISLEGVQVQTNYNSGSAGTWKKLGPFAVTINDGTIDLAIIGLHGNLSGIEIWKAGNSNNRPPVVSTPLADQSATVGTAFSYVIPLNAFSDPDPSTALSYSANLTNGGPLPTWLSFNAATRSFSGTPTGAAGAIEVRVTASDGAGGTVNDIFSLNVNSGQGSVFYRAFNLNGPSISIDGNNWEASSGAPNFSATGLTFASQGVSLVPSTDANRATMIRSSYWGNANVTVQAVPAGNYQVWVYVWEDNFTFTFSLSLEGQVVQTNYISGSAGTWKKLGPFPVSISDGTINLAAIGFQGNLSGVEIWTGSSSQLKSPASARMAPLISEEEEEKPAVLRLSAYPNPFSQKVTVAFSTAESALTTINMYDMRGIKVRSVFERNVEKGFSEEFELESSGLIDGMYVLEMINGVKTKRLKIMMVR